MKRLKAEYARRITQLCKKLKKAGGKVSLRPVEDPMEQLLRGILGTFASESRAQSAHAKLVAAVVDLNELRVTPVSEIVEIIGTDFPSCRKASEEVSRTLNSIFNRIHALDLGFLKTSSRKVAEGFLASLDGAGPHAKALVLQRCLNAHVIPVDQHMHAFLQRSRCLPEDTTVEDAQRFLTGNIKERDGVSFYVLLKRHAAAHALRKAPAASAARKSKAKAAKPRVKTAAQAAPSKMARKRTVSKRSAGRKKAAAKKATKRPGTSGSRRSAGRRRH